MMLTITQLRYCDAGLPAARDASPAAGSALWDCALGDKMSNCNLKNGFCRKFFRKYLYFIAKCHKFAMQTCI